MRKGDRETKGKTLWQSRIVFVIKLERSILELISSDCVEDDFL